MPQNRTMLDVLWSATAFFLTFILIAAYYVFAFYLSVKVFRNNKQVPQLFITVANSVIAVLSFLILILNAMERSGTNFWIALPHLLLPVSGFMTLWLCKINPVSESQLVRTLVKGVVTSMVAAGVGVFFLYVQINRSADNEASMGFVLIPLIYGVFLIVGSLIATIRHLMIASKSNHNLKGE